MLRARIRDIFLKSEMTENSHLIKVFIGIREVVMCV
jgi:hypothetical protein